MPGSFSSNHSNGGLTGVAALRKVTSGVGDVNHAQLGPYKDSLKATDRKKVGPLYVAARKWVKVDRNGTSSIIQAEKNELTQKLGVQLRDLRVLDPYLAASYPSAILSRDRALVVNLEHIKCIIATDHVLVTNAEDDTVLAFVEELQRRCASCIDSDGGKQNTNQSSPDLVVLSDKGDMTKENMFPFLEIPFELRVLEVVLESVCTHLERLTSELEAAAHPALDALTNKVSTHNLERVRRIKNRMVRLNTRVETIHELLEKLLDDDSDMKDINLTAKQLDMERTVSLQRNSLKAGQPPGSPFGAEPEDDDADVQEVEMVLETYFMHIDNTYNKLQTLTEYIDDTEDYINIELDNQRNQLIRIELVLTAATFAVAIIGSIAGIFGMNLNNGHEDSHTLFPSGHDRRHCWRSFGLCCSHSLLQAQEASGMICSYSKTEEVLAKADKIKKSDQTAHSWNSYRRLFSYDCNHAMSGLAFYVPDHGCKTQNVQHCQIIRARFLSPNNTVLQGTSFTGNTCYWLKSCYQRYNRASSMHSQSQASTTQILQTALALLSGCLRMHSSSLSFHKHAAVVLLICLGAATCTHAKRAATYNARARSGEAWAQLNQSSAVTSYGKPVVEQLTKTTSVDHFSQAQYEPDGDSTFELRYVLIRPATPPNTSTPILLFCSEESALEDSQVGSGYYSDIANSIGALQIWPEHRYYATQQPFRPSDSRFVYLNIEQALVDQIEVVLHTQRTLGLSHSPVIAVGSSYSGQLAAWLRVRYPDVIAGAISSSPTLLGAPGLGLDPSYDPYGFAKIATRTASSEAGSAAACPTNVHKFFTTLFARAQTAEGLEQINTDLNLCRNSEVQSYDDVNATLAYYVLSNWASAAQFNFPYALPGTGQTDIPAYPVREACNLLANDTLEGTPLFYAMGQALPIFSGNANISGGCLDTSAGGPSAFGYQICTQDYTPVSYDGVQDMFYDLPYNLDSNSQRCLQQYGVAPQYDWSASTFGLSSLRSSSNIFFTNGIYDPFTACGPTVNISDTITATIYEGPHAFDVESTKPEDPASAVQARAQGLQYIQTWVNQYNAQKASIPMSNPSDLFNLAFDVGGYTSAWNNTLPGSNTNNTDAILSGTAAIYNSSV